MASIKGKDTAPERFVRSMLHRRGYRFRKHVKELPGCPDVVFPSDRVVVFIDGDFWHGYRFPTWQERLGTTWRAKIHRNRLRDQRNFRKLRKLGWKVVRVWEHEVKRTPDQAVARIIAVLNVARNGPP